VRDCEAVYIKALQWYATEVVGAMQCYITSGNREPSADRSVKSVVLPACGSGSWHGSDVCVVGLSGSTVREGCGSGSWGGG
jgi:hypothetical protein